MQGDWSLSKWLQNGLPLNLFRASERRDFATVSNSYLRNIQILSILNSLCGDQGRKPRKRDVSGAWTAALESAFACIPWQQWSNICGRAKTFNKSEFHRTSGHSSCRQTDFFNSLRQQFPSSHSLKLFLLLEYLFVQGHALCGPAAFAWTCANLQPFENLPSDLLPAQLAKGGEATLENELLLGEKIKSLEAARLHTQISFQDDIIVEPKTGFRFPTVLYPDPVSMQMMEPGMQVLAGVGLKSVTIMKLKSIKIYAFGLYIRPDALKAQLSRKYRDVSMEELKHNPGFYADVLSHDLGMTMRLMVHYKALKMGMVKSAFDTALRNRLRKIKGMEDDVGLKSFNAFFSQELLLPKGTIIDFRWLPGGQLRTEIDGRLLGTIHSRHFCQAFFDIYIGDTPVSSKAKEDMGQNLSQILQKP